MAPIAPEPEGAPKPETLEKARVIRRRLDDLPDCYEGGADGGLYRCLPPVADDVIALALEEAVLTRDREWCYAHGWREGAFKDGKPFTPEHHAEIMRESLAVAEEQGKGASETAVEERNRDLRDANEHVKSLRAAVESLTKKLEGFRAAYENRRVRANEEIEAARAEATKAERERHNSYSKTYDVESGHWCHACDVRPSSPTPPTSPCRCGGLYEDPHRPGCPEYLSTSPPTEEER